MTDKTYDLIVIGTGTAASVTAFGCRKADWSVAIADHRPYGGTCALRGCDPKKMLIAATEVIDGYERTRALGVDVRLGHEVRAVRKTDDGFEVEAYGPEGRVIIETDRAIHSGGRRPALDALDLDAADIAHDNGKLSLDEHFRSTSNTAVYAAGDAGGGPLPLTPVAALEAHAVIDNLLANKGATVDYTGIPSVVFTLPSLARVGLLEAEAREQGLRFNVKHESVPGWFTARCVNEPCYAYKILVEEDSGRILGAHLIGPEASEVINLFGFAMRSGLSADAIRHATFAYPTAASDIESMLP